MSNEGDTVTDRCGQATDGTRWPTRDQLADRLPTDTLDRRWIGALVASKLADTIVTVVGLTTTGVTERNPVAARAFATAGAVPGTAALTVVALVVAIGGVELGVSRLEDPVWSRRLRRFGYGPLVALWLFVSLRNLAVLV